MTVAAMAAATTATVTAAVPQVTDVTMTQGSGGRLVTIAYTLAEASAVVTLEVQTNANTSAAADDPGWTSIGGAAVSNAKGDVWKKVQTGNRTITWRPDLSWPDHIVPNGGARAKVTAWALDNTPNYMVVDISEAAQPNTQTYYPSADFVPGGVTNCHYKMSTLLMRKIMAKDVTWTMGSVAESGRTPAREATHQVTLTNNYYIGVYHVTQTQWQQITGYNPSCFTTDRAMRPVEQVSYTDIRQGKGTATTTATASGGVYPDKPHANSFLGLLRNKTNLDFDLPSEAQWEFAARAGSGEGYWGDGSAMRISSNKDAGLDLLGRYQYNGGKIGANNATTPAGNCEATNATAIVGSYAPNAWGLYDMHGNVWVWCLDIFANDITALNGAVNTVSGTDRVFRGGSWMNGAESCRPASRSGGGATARAYNLGCRIVCTAGLQ